MAWFFLNRVKWAVPVAASEGAGTAVGDATCSGVGQTIANITGTAVGDAICNGSIVDATAPVVVVTPSADTGTGGVSKFPGVWRNRPGFPKAKKKKLDALDVLIAELKSRVVEAPEPPPDIERTLRVSQALSNQMAPDMGEIENHIALLKAAIEEIDDEEAILLLAA